MRKSEANCRRMVLSHWVWNDWSPFAKSRLHARWRQTTMHFSSDMYLVYGFKPSSSACNNFRMWSIVDFDSIIGRYALFVCLITLHCLSFVINILYCNKNTMSFMQNKYRKYFTIIICLFAFIFHVKKNVSHRTKKNPHFFASWKFAPSVNSPIGIYCFDSKASSSRQTFTPNFRVQCEKAFRLNRCKQTWPRL